MRIKLLRKTKYFYFITTLAVFVFDDYELDENYKLEQQKIATLDNLKITKRESKQTENNNKKRLG
jgi:hypothetical protein